MLDGEAMVRAQGAADFEHVSSGAHVALGSALRAPDDSSVALTLTDGVTVSLAPGAAASLNTVTWLPAEGPGAKPARAFQIALTSGEMRVNVPIEAGHPRGLIVMFPGGSSFSTWRGSADLAVKGDKANAVLFGGTAIAGGGGQWRPIHVGGSAVFAGNSAPVLHGSIPAAPAWTATSSPSFAIVRTSERARLPMAWSAVDGAAAYRLEVASDPDMMHLVARSDVEGLVSMTGALQGGHYFARVRGITSDGVVGNASTPKSLRVAEITTPPTGFIASDGAIVVPPASAVLVPDPRDVEVAYQRAPKMSYEPVWGPAPNEIRVGSEPLRIVRFRDAITHAEADMRLTLVRRDLRAVVEMTPKGARWPEQPISITVRAQDPSGRLDAANEPLTIDVKINLDPAPLNWTHTGNVWTARLTPGVPPGPWAVRVSVQDGTGTQIGAGLLEVEGPRIERAAHRVADTTEVHVSH